MSEKDHVILSGIQPTGGLHLGNWAGAVRNWLELQEKHPGRCIFTIVDYHSMTIDYEPAEKQAQVLDLAATLLALGIDPKRSTLFVQSHAPECTELAWILDTVTPVSEMLKMTQYKDKSARQEKNVNMGLLNYPVLQAADILLYRGTRVPVGEDQVQHVETTRVIARAFNKRFGETFAEPSALLTATPRVMSLTEPAKKMSKSRGPNSYLALDDEPEVILAKLKRVPTEPTGIVSKERLEREDYAGVRLLFDLLDLFGSEGERKAAYAGEKVSYGALKNRVAEVIGLHFAEYRERKKKLLASPGKVLKALEDGAKRARKAAEATMKEVRRKTGLRP